LTTFTEQFERYLARFRKRLANLVIARGLALMGVAALVITIVAVLLASRAGFPTDLLVAARLILFGSLAVLAYFYISRPKRRLQESGATDIEGRTPAFGGRAETYLDMRGTDNPLRELLAEDAVLIAREHPPETRIKSSEFRYAWSAAAVSVSALIILAIAGPGNYAYGVRSLWIGWALPGLLPPQTIEVSPGDDGIRLGGNVKVRAVMQGFSPNEAWVHASFGDGAWQRVPMSAGDGGFEFTFFSVREPLEYYVSASNTRSPTFDVSVVDLPVIEKLALTYHYPDWTGREPETFDPGGDVRAISETQIELQVTADRPMTPGELIVNDRAIPLNTDGSRATATFSVEADGQYFVAAKLGGDRIRLTDDYFITLEEDEAPKIEFERPGRDWSASRVEEVTTRITAEDDYAIESLEMRFSINGSDWQAIELEADSNLAKLDHVFFLESLSQDGLQGALAPGDLISYYAVAEDRENSARTDIFFIDVQPFDRRYSQSQQAGGGMAGQQGGQQTEVSDRQREIIISTWNLIRKQSEKRRNDDAYVTDNAALLSRLQSTLKDQVETLIQRTVARQLTATDEEIATFIEHLQKAASAMAPAAERLAEIELEQAILPEQEALQHLLAAEAVFTDITVSLQASNRGGGGGQAGRDLTEMFELEMDLEKNQYETGSTATPNAPQQDMQDTADELADLARRQEQLARNMSRNQAPAPAQRWQQERLRREVEELRERLDQLARAAADDQQRSSTAEGEPGASSSQSATGTGTNRDIDELQRRLASAERAMNDADQAMRNDASPEELQRAMQEAQRQLEGARDRASQAQQQSMRASLSDLASRADALHEEQSALEDKLQDAVHDALENRENANRLSSGLTRSEEYEIATEKRELQAELQGLQQDARRVAQEIEDDWPRVASELVDGIKKIEELEIEARIAVAAAYIEQGEAVYVAASESIVTEALRDLRDDMAQAEELLGGSGDGQAAGTSRDRLQETLADTRELRRNLQRMADSAGEAAGIRSWGRDDLQRSTGMEIDDLQIARDLEQRSSEVSQDVLDLARELSGSATAFQSAEELRHLAAGIRESDFSGNLELLAREARQALSLVEQLELALTKSARRNDGGVRTNATEEIPEVYREPVADYYRKLGQTEESDAP